VLYHRPGSEAEAKRLAALLPPPVTVTALKKKGWLSFIVVLAAKK